MTFHFDESTIYEVSELNLEAKALLNEHFGIITVIGEISNLSRPSSGHLYFSLKDNSAQVRCALFRFQHQRTACQVNNGQQVIVQAQVSLYEARGDYQLIVTKIAPAGAGKLQIAFEQLKKELDNAGYFNENTKKSIPKLPKHIGIITSATGAALQDILKVLKRRFPAIPISLYPTAVQGEMAAKQIATAITTASQHAECDLLIVARGGGSLEDLWVFNERIVAEAIYSCDIPVITGIGHQTDFTIADFVADMRAATPSAAAETAAPDQAEYISLLQHLKKQLTHLITHQVTQHRLQLSKLERHLIHPRDKLRQLAQHIDAMEKQLHQHMQHTLQTKIQQLSHYAKTLDTLSPLKTLSRGYSITKQQSNHSVITDTRAISVGDTVTTSVQNGQFESIISVILTK